MAETVSRHWIEGLAIHLLHKYLLNGDFISVGFTRGSMQTSGASLESGLEC